MDQIEHVFVNWSLDMYAAGAPAPFPGIVLGVPAAAATLLRCYASLWVSGATGQPLPADVLNLTGVVLPPDTAAAHALIERVTLELAPRWESNPHHHFHGTEGGARLIVRPSLGKKVPHPPSSQLCAHHALSLLEVKKADGVAYSCNDRECSRRHVKRSDMTAPWFNDFLTSSCTGTRKYLATLIRAQLSPSGVLPVTKLPPSGVLPVTKKLHQLLTLQSRVAAALLRGACCIFTDRPAPRPRRVLAWCPHRYPHLGCLWISIVSCRGGLSPAPAFTWN